MVVLVFEDFRSRLYKALTKAIPGLDNKDLLLDSSGHGDFTIRLFRIVKDMKTTPDKIFSIVQDELSSEDYIDKMELVGSYINFSIKPERMFAVINESLARTGQYPDIFQDPERILVEHTSANPTGPLHVGRVRGSIIGDSLAKLLTRYGYRVSTQYYINDSGKQMIALYEGFLRYGKNSMTVGSLLKGYQDIYREMESDKSIAGELEKIIVAYESGDRSIIMKIREIASVMLQDIRDSLMQLDIKIDDYVWESDFLLGGDVDNVMHELSDSLEDEDGARFITTDEGNKVFLRRKDGTSLYFARDIAYHMFKSLNFDWFIDVLGEAHKDHGKNLTYVLKELLELDQKLDFLYYGFVSLESGKMSTRMGKIVSLHPPPPGDVAGPGPGPGRRPRAGPGGRAPPRRPAGPTSAPRRSRSRVRPCPRRRRPGRSSESKYLTQSACGRRHRSDEPPGRRSAPWSSSTEPVVVPGRTRHLRVCWRALSRWGSAEWPGHREPREVGAYGGERSTCRSALRRLL